MRIVAHMDMDAFYASVEERLNPALRGRPVVVGADPKGGAGRGVVTAASYAARKYGIRSALPISRAWRLAEAARRRGEPEAVFVRDNRQAYREASTRIMALIADGVDAFEGASIDEAYVDLSSLGGFDEAAAHARALKAPVREREELTCSVGLGPNKLVAKIASDFQKPDGLTVVRPDDVLGFLGGLPVRVIPGIGPKTEAALGERGIATVADLRAVEPARLAEWFGKLGLELHDKSRGISDDPVSNEMDRMGYDTFWRAEHHFQHEGYECIPNVLMYVVHLSHVTRRLRLGCGFNVTPMWHPLRLAEDFAVADVLTGGRVTFGVGRGYHTREVETFGAPLLDQAANRELFEEQV